MYLPRHVASNLSEPDRRPIRPSRDEKHDSPDRLDHKYVDHAHSMNIISPQRRKSSILADRFPRSALKPLPDNMKFSTAAVLSALLCAEVALARPAESGFARRLARRGRSAGRSPSFRKVNEHATVQSNWGGAILIGEDFSTVSAVANVPKGGGGSSAAGTAWVGIDGDTCQTAILQTGFDWYGDGTYDAWYEWYPEVSGKCPCPIYRVE